jgi:hypothetical protein
VTSHWAFGRVFQVLRTLALPDRIAAGVDPSPSGNGRSLASDRPQAVLNMAFSTTDPSGKKVCMPIFRGPLGDRFGDFASAINNRLLRRESTPKQCLKPETKPILPPDGILARHTMAEMANIVFVINTLCWSGRRDSNPRPSAPKADPIIYGNLLKFVENKCFRWRALPRAGRFLLILVASGCSDRYKFD